MFAAFVVSPLLFWVCVVVLTVGMVSPRLVLRGERRTRGRVGAIYGSLAGGVMIASMIIGVGAAVNDPGFQEAAAVAVQPGPATESGAPSAGKAAESPIAKRDRTIDARENDLEELCKDWLFYRKQILEAEARGDHAAASKHRAAFQRVNGWLDEYGEDDVSAMMSKLEAEGYRAP